MSPTLTLALALAGGYLLRFLGVGKSYLPDPTTTVKAVPVSTAPAVAAPAAAIQIPTSGGSHPLATYLMDQLAGVLATHVQELIGTTLSQAVKPTVPAIPVTPAPSAPNLTPRAEPAPVPAPVVQHAA